MKMILSNESKISLIQYSVVQRCRQP